MRILCLDIGEKRIGVAVSDPMGWTAQGIETIPNEGFQKSFERIRTLCNQYETDCILCGLPRNMDGTEGFQAERIRSFAGKLEKRGFHVLFQDERLTTKLARDILLEADVSRAKRKKSIDMLAATYILQTYLDSKQNPIPKKLIGGKYTMSDIEKKLPEEAIDNMDALEEDGEYEQENIVELVDEEGNELVFEHLMTLEHKGQAYICLVPMEPMEDVDEDELVIMRIEQDDEGNDFYATVEDETELNEVYEQYLELAEADE